MKIIKVLQDVRKARGTTLEEVALAAGTDVGNLSRIERGMQRPSIELVEQIAKALQIRMSALYLLAEEAEQQEMATQPDNALLLAKQFRTLSAPNQRLALGLLKVLKSHQRA